MSGVRDRLGRVPLRRHGILGAIVGLSVVAAIVVAAPAAGAAEKGAQTAKQTRALWTGSGGHAEAGAHRGARGDQARPLPFVQAGPRRAARARSPGQRSGLVVSLPAPGGGFQRFALELSPVMEPALARRHPTIKTFAGRGLDDPNATIRADIGPLGLPRLGALRRGAVVHRPVLPQRPEPLRQLLRARPRQRPRRLRRARGRRVRGRGRSRPSSRRRSPSPRAARHPADLPAGAPQRPDLRDLLRRAGERDGGEGHARQPRQPDLRGRDRRPDGPRRRTTTSSTWTRRRR